VIGFPPLTVSPHKKISDASRTTSHLLAAKIKTAAVEGTPVFKERNPGFCCAAWRGPQKKQDIAKCSPFMSILYETKYARII